MTFAAPGGVLRIQRILVATDFTEASERAIDYALELAGQFGASVTLMHAYEIPVVGFPDGAFIANPSTATEIAEASAKALHATVARRSGAGVVIDSVLREGPVAEEVNALAGELDADIIVLGTHGRRGIAHAILGSVAERVIRTAKRPVLTIHEAPPPREARESAPSERQASR